MCVHVSPHQYSQFGTVELQEWVEEAGSPVQIFQVFIITMMIMLLSIPPQMHLEPTTYRVLYSIKEL